MFRHERFFLYGTVLLLLCVLTNILVISNITKTNSLPDNLNNTKTQNDSSNENITMAQNAPENSNSTIIQTFSDIFYSLFAPNTESKTNTMRKLIKSLTDEKNYDKNIRPDFGGKPRNDKFRVWTVTYIQFHVHVLEYLEKAVDVYFKIYVTDIISVSDYTNDFAVNVVVTQQWRDSRLQFTPINNVTYLTLVRDTVKLIWLPDSHILNSKSLSMQLSDSTLTSAYVSVNKYGAVFYYNTFSATVNCPMDLKYFPVDQQICNLVFTSYGFSNTSITHSWNPYIPKPVSIHPNISLSTFTLTSYNASKQSYNGKYDELICEFRFKRTLGYYINQIYVPSFMIVIISWIPFWLNRADHYARVGLGVTTVLTITTMVISTNESLPKTSYIKAIDVYLFVCFLMVFLAMIEFATIGFFESVQRKRKKKKPTKGKLNGNVSKLKASSKTKKRNTAQIDKVSRVLFPAGFITFNLIYVGVLYYISNYFYIDNFRYKYEG